MERHSDKIIDEAFLKAHPKCIFVFGDNVLRVGKGGAAKLRHLPNTYGFITKKKPTYDPVDFYTQSEYIPIFQNELSKLELIVKTYPETIFLISRIGSGLANKYQIFENVILPGLKEWKKKMTGFNNIEFLWDIDNDKAQ